jgi:hypothetical protein
MINEDKLGQASTSGSPEASAADTKPSPRRGRSTAPRAASALAGEPGDAEPVALSPRRNDPFQSRRRVWPD